MPDNWGFVAAAYGVAVLVLGGYWRFLRRREHRSEGASTKRSGGKAAARTRQAPR